jgi:hypothetical protein
MTGQTYVSFRVAGLAGHQILSRLPAMDAGPFMGRQHRVWMTGLTHIRGKEIMLDITRHTATPPLSVRLNGQVLRGKACMTVNAELVLMAA